MEADVSAKSRKRVRKREDLLWNVRRAVASSPNALDKTTLRLCEAAPFTVHNSSYRGGWRRARARSSAAVARLRLVRGSSRPRTRLLQRGFLRPPLYFSLASGFTLARESEPVWARMRRKPLRTRYQNTPEKLCKRVTHFYTSTTHTCSAIDFTRQCPPFTVRVFAYFAFFPPKTNVSRFVNNNDNQNVYVVDVFNTFFIICFSGSLWIWKPCL